MTKRVCIQCWILKQKFAQGSIVSPPKTISFKKWADCQRTRGRIDPCRSHSEGSCSSGRNTVSVLGLAFQFLEVFVLNKERKAMLNVAAQWKSSVEYTCQLLKNAVNSSTSAELSWGSLHRVGLRVPGDFSHSVVKQLFPEACYPHTHTSLKIAMCPSPASLCFQKHSRLALPPGLSFIFLLGKQGIRKFCFVGCKLFFKHFQPW